MMVESQMGTIPVTAFAFAGDTTFYDAISGQPLPSDYEGYCQVLFRDGRPTIFKTGINGYGERYWVAVGNVPKAEVHFVSYGLTKQPRRMINMTYRAAYWTDGKGAEVVLTLPEHAQLSDAELIAEARRYAEEVGLDLSYGEIVIGEWTE